MASYLSGLGSGLGTRLGSLFKGNTSTTQPSYTSSTLSNILPTKTSMSSSDSGDTFNNVMIGIGILLILIAAIIVIDSYAKKYKEIRNIITMPVVSANNGILIKSADFPTTIPNKGIKFTLSMWIYVSNWMYGRGKRKNIFRKGDFRIYLHEETNDLHIDVPMFPVEVKKTGTLSTYATIETLKFVDFPIQKWVNMVVVVDGRSVDLWINGKIYQSISLPNIIYFNNADNVYLISPSLAKKKKVGTTFLDIEKDSVGGYDGYLASTVYFPYPLPREDIIALFERGPYPTGFINKYNERLLQYLFMKSVPIQMGKDIQFEKVGKSGAELASNEALLAEYINSAAATINPGQS